MPKVGAQGSLPTRGYDTKTHIGNGQSGNGSYNMAPEKKFSIWYHQLILFASWKQSKAPMKFVKVFAFAILSLENTGGLKHPDIEDNPRFRHASEQHARRVHKGDSPQG